MHIREATSDDVPGLAIMNKQLIEDEASENTMLLSDLESRMQKFMEKGWKVIIAEEESIPVAYSTYFLQDDEYEPSKKRVHVGHFYVRRERRRMGFGREFFTLLCKTYFPPDAKIALDVLSKNERAQSFYRSLGFTEYSIMMERDAIVSSQE